MRNSAPDVVALLGRTAADVQATILSGLDGDAFDQAEVDAIADLVRDRAVAALGDTLRVEIAAALVAGPAPIADNLLDVDVAVEIVHDWLVGHDHASLLRAADEMDALLEERAAVQAAWDENTTSTGELVDALTRYTRRYDALGLAFSIGETAMIALPSSGGVAVMTAVEGRTLSHVDFRGDGDGDEAVTPTPVLVA